MGKFIRGLAWIVGLLLLVAGVLRLVLFKVWTVPDDLALSSSLAPSLWAGDVVLVTTRGTPGFGDLVRCRDPENALRFVAGRIIGLAGDTVEVDGGRVVVEGKAYGRESACPEETFLVPHPTTGADFEVGCGVVKMGGDWYYAGLPLHTMPGLRGRVEVGEGMVFLLSDNRALPNDSRIYGTVPAEDCSEKIVFRLVGAEGFADGAKRLSYIR